MDNNSFLIVAQNKTSLLLNIFCAQINSNNYLQTHLQTYHQRFIKNGKLQVRLVY